MCIFAVEQYKIIMIRFKNTLLLVVITASSFFTRADEGMWLPFMLGRNYEDMKAHGLNLTAEQIYSINSGSIKDAIISFGGFCTGEIISKNGLILTNHHCGYDAIAGASTSEHNYLDNGFWAKNHGEEIAIPGLTATFMIRMEDVSATINKELNNSMTTAEREAKIKELVAILTKDAVAGTHYEAFVKDFYDGNEFYLFVKETFKDIRFVGTPPQSVGKFGGDTDNWMWPRHTADFSMFRVYSGADNKPAAYSPDNKPFDARYNLPISIKGVQENDYAMIFGFPGTTQRYMTSFGIDEVVNIEQPKRVDIRGKKLEVMKSFMDKDTDVRLMYSSNYANIANYWKNFIGQEEQVKKNGVIAKKKELEQEFLNFTKGKAEYANVLSDIENAYKLKAQIAVIKAYQNEFVYSVEGSLRAYRYKFLVEVAGDKDKFAQFVPRLKEATMASFEESDIAVENEILRQVVAMYLKDVPQDQMGPLCKKLALGGWDKYMKTIETKSVFTNKARYEKFAANPTVKAIEADPLYKLIMDMNNAFTKVSSTAEQLEAEDKLKNGNRLFVKAIMEMQPKKAFYPNANSTMRLTYGNVMPYDPKDGVSYHYTTTIDGVLQKEDPTNPEFVVDARIKEVWQQKDYGQYADKKSGNLVVNFLTNNDITGGNSGSPTINGDGQLIGVAFDGNWEAMSGNYFFEPKIQRTIVVDIRYVLWLVDKCYGATNLIEEMTLVK